MKKEVIIHIQTIPNWSSSKVLSFFKKIHLHLLHFHYKFLNANIVI